MLLRQSQMAHPRTARVWNLGWWLVRRRWWPQNLRCSTGIVCLSLVEETTESERGQRGQPYAWRTSCSIAHGRSRAESLW